MFEVSFPGGVAVDVAVGGTTVRTDQPQPLGAGSAASPFDLFLASIAACAGFYALRFCQEREIPTAGLRVSLEPERDATKRLVSVRIHVRLPEEFPEKYRAAIARAIDHCAVKRAITEPPRFELDVVA